MTKRIILSLAMIALTIAGVTSATIAYFSDTAVSTSNTFTAGTLDLTLGETTTPLTLTNMKPGDVSGAQCITVKNDGSIPGWLGINSAYIEADSNTGSINMNADFTANQMIVTSFTADTVEIVSAIPDINGDGRRTVYDMVNDSSGVLPPHFGIKYHSYDTDMIAGETHTYCANIQFDPNTGNDYQGDGISWNFTFLLDQQ